MRSKAATHNYYINLLGFAQVGADYDDYLMVKKDNIEIHFFLFKQLDPAQNYGQVYIRLTGIENLYAQLQSSGVTIHPNGALQTKPWGQTEFALLDPDNNLLTFGEGS